MMPRALVVPGLLALAVRSQASGALQIPQ